MTTFTDGVQPSVNPEPGDEAGGPPGPGAAHHEETTPDDRETESAEGREDDDADDGTDSESGWLRDEIQRRIAVGQSAIGGRHARRESVDSTASFGYVPRHSVATPGPGAPRPQPVGPVASRPSGLLRRERTGEVPIFPPLAPAAWSRPQRPDGPDPESDVDATRPGLPVLPATLDPLPAAPAPPAPTEQATDAFDGLAPGTSPGDGPSDAPVAVPELSGDPLFTARTPAPGSRTRATSSSVPEQGSTDQASGSDASDDVENRRVRVVLAERKGVARPVRTVVDIQEGTGVGELLRSNLIGSQLAVALRFAVVAGVSLGVLPLLFAVFPAIGRMEVFGLRLPWLLLGVLVYPFLFGLGLWHTRTAERVEQNFADHVQD